MKRISLLMIAMATAFAVNAQPPAGDAKSGDFYGEKISASNAVEISAIPDQLVKKDSFDTKVRAKVLDVCPKKGCWMKVQVDDKTTAFVMMKDYDFFVPTAIKGKTIIIDGEVKTKNTSVEDLKHFAKDAKKSQAEIDAIKEPKSEIRFTAKGILVVE